MTAAGQWEAGGALLRLWGRAYKFKLGPSSDRWLGARSWAWWREGCGAWDCAAAARGPRRRFLPSPPGTPGGAGPAGGGKEPQPGGFRGGSAPPPTPSGSGKFKCKRSQLLLARLGEARVTEGVVTASPPGGGAREAGRRPRCGVRAAKPLRAGPQRRLVRSQVRPADTFLSRRAARVPKLAGKIPGNQKP